MKKIIIIAFVSWTLLLFSQQNENFLDFTGEDKFHSTCQINDLADGGLEVEYKFSGAQIYEIFQNGEKFQFLHLKDFGKMSEVGKPALPQHIDIIALPQADKPNIQILDYKIQTFQNFNIHPALKPARDTEGAPEPEFQINRSLYQTNAFYPENAVETIKIVKIRGIPLAYVQLRPIQYNPVTKEIKIYTQIKYRIEFQGERSSLANVAEENSHHFTKLLKNVVINNQNVADGILHPNSRNGRKDYIIITHDEYLEQANDLANWKRQLGYSAEVVSQSSWNATQVDNEIKARYNSWLPHPDYFVIIGDHTGNYAVPGEIYQDPNYNDDFATDHYYACMDGGSDYVADMAHGRISVSSAAEAEVVVQKIINYEKDPPTNSSFYQNGLNCAQYQDDDNNGYADRRFCHTSEEIRDYTISQGYNVDRIYYTNSSANVTNLHYNNGHYSNGQLLPSDLRSTSFDWSGGSSDITSTINAGKFYVFHRDHGYVGGSGWAHPYYTTTSMNNLSNGEELPVIFSINCHTGEFQLPNCFAEKFLRMENKGAVGVVAAAYYSYSGFNDGLSCGMIDAIWHNPGLIPNFGSGASGSGVNPLSSDIFTMGDVVNQGLIRMTETWGNNVYTHELFHYFGDPAMRIWTDNPNNTIISANHQDHILEGEASFDIYGCNVYDALATLVFDGELIGETTLSAGSGTITFSALSDASENAILTISKHNCLPYEISLPIDALYPEITLSATAFVESLGLNQTDQQILMISNDGTDGSTLNYEMIVAENENRNLQRSSFSKNRSKRNEPRFSYDTAELAYHNGYSNGIGTSEEDTWTCASRFTSSELSSYYADYSISKIKILLHSLDYSACTIKIWEDGSFGNPGTEIYSEEIEGYIAAGDWFTHNVFPAIELESNKEYWVGYEIDATGDHPSAIDNSSMVAGKGGWINFDTDWQQLTDHGLDANFCIEMVMNNKYSVYPFPDWLSLSQDAGNIVSGENDEIVLDFHSSDLVAGIYEAEIELENNDADENPTLISVTLNVNDNSGSGSGNNHGDPGNNFPIDLPVVNIDGDAVDPDVEVDPAGTDELTINVTVNENAQNPVAYPETVSLSYFVNIDGTITGDLLFDLSYSGLNIQPVGILYWDEDNWENIIDADWSTPEHVLVNVDLTGRSTETEFILTEDNPLPVTLSSFYAYQDEERIILKWTTEREEDNAGWNIYRGLSAEALNEDETINLNFEFIPGAGTTSQITEYEFADEQENYHDTTFWYWLEAVDIDGVSTLFNPISIDYQGEKESPEIPLDYGLQQNYPNPFNPSTTISFSITTESTEKVGIEIFNVKGQKIRTLECIDCDNAASSPMMHSIVWDGRDDSGKAVPSGIYYYKLNAGKQSETKKMILLK